MNKQEFDALKQVGEKVQVLTIEDLTDKTPRTLLYGYTTNRWTWHVYLSEDGIEAICYREPNDLNSITIEENSDFVPNKRLHPEACDFEFCQLLKQEGIPLPFTTWNEEREEKTFYGLRRSFTGKLRN